MFLTAPSGTVQIPVSAVQLHQVGAEWYSQGFRGCPYSATACTSFVGVGRPGPLSRASPQIWESCQCRPRLGEEVLSSLDMCPEGTVSLWLLAHRVLGHAVHRCFLIPFLSRWLLSGSRAAVAAA